MGKATKATKKFISSGKLKKTIQDRKKHREIKKRFESRRGAKGKGKQGGGEVEDEDDEEEREEEDLSEGEEERGKGKGMTVDDFLGGGFMGSDDDEVRGGLTARRDAGTDRLRRTWREERQGRTLRTTRRRSTTTRPSRR